MVRTPQESALINWQSCEIHNVNRNWRPSLPATANSSFFDKQKSINISRLLLWIPTGYYPMGSNFLPETLPKFTQSLRYACHNVCRSLFATSNPLRELRLTQRSLSNYNRESLLENFKVEAFSGPDVALNIQFKK